MKQKLLSLCFLFCLSLDANRALFDTPKSLQSNVDFWLKVYSFFDSNEVVFFDEKDPSLIYAVLELPKVKNEISSPKYKPLVVKKFQSIEDILESLASGKKIEEPTDEYRQIEKLISERSLLSQPDLKKRLRYQNGLKSQFALGLKLSGRYIDEMKAVLKTQNLPLELIALVFVESLFYIEANSYASASGPWGIIKETGIMSGIHINNFIDERYDPILSTLAAASFLQKTKKGLGEWPLAITAYNYGYPGMLRAVGNLGTYEIEKIIAAHESPIFGFASKNYYAEFLAALTIYSNYKDYFSDIVLDKPWRYELVTAPKAIAVKDLINVKAITREGLAEYNPGLTKRVLNSEEIIPAGYSLRVPFGKAKNFYERFKKIKASCHAWAQQKVSTRIKARGESLNTIADRHGVRTEYLTKKFNKPPKYRPKGTVVIRSEAHRFSKLPDISKQIMAQTEQPNHKKAKGK